MVGTILNAIGILLGGAVGLIWSRQIAPVHQKILKAILGIIIVYLGLSMTWDSLTGGVLHRLKQLLIVVLALMLGRLIGRALRLQKGLNRLGQIAKEKFSNAKPGDENRLSEGFVTCTLLFCVGPMAFLGAVQDGLTGNYRTLAIKAAIDGLSTLAFSKVFGWGVLLSVIPVVAYQGTITLLAKAAGPYLEHRELLDSVNATGGLLVFCIALIILELKKIELADYLPSLAAAALITWLWG
ncbi:MAG: DUF554 domain-containing protein [Verrucomicrobia bacterium]|nr:DUF554 domain-containing protein [Verrucomicrobiota bacterium]